MKAYDATFQLNAKFVDFFSKNLIFTRVIARVRGLQDTLDLQNDLQTIYQWSSTNNAQFNAEKFECMRYGYNEEIETTTSYLSNTGSQIKNSDAVKDLGVASGVTP